jgi:hypothetical protein
MADIIRYAMGGSWLFLVLAATCAIGAWAAAQRLTNLARQDTP